MAIQSQPSRISEPFAGSGTKNVIPATNATPSASQAASWASGFPPECSQPISAGGCPVPRDDMNGVLNWLSQGLAYQQDGGVWAWSALADYDVQRVVRGSDGLLYFSIAQSGPNVGGAQDPTTDTSHTYWAAPEVPTMTGSGVPGTAAANVDLLNGKIASFAATQATVYVSTTGNDSNDGLTPATPKATLAGAYAVFLGNTIFPSRITINFAIGTYNFDLYSSEYFSSIILAGPSSGGYAVFNSGIFTNGNTNVYLNGLIQLTKPLYVYRNVTLILGDGLTLNFNNLGSVASAIEVYQQGKITANAVNAGNGPKIRFTGTNTFSIGTVHAYNSGIASFPSSNCSFAISSGTTTGPRFYCEGLGAIVDTGSTSFITGTSAGQTTALGYYS